MRGHDALVTTGAGGGACTTTGGGAEAGGGAEPAAGAPVGADALEPVGVLTTWRTIKVRRTMRRSITGRVVVATACAFGARAGSCPATIWIERPAQSATKATLASAATLAIVERSEGTRLRAAPLRDAARRVPCPC
jgi:hypothetical protein